MAATISRDVDWLLRASGGEIKMSVDVSKAHYEGIHSFTLILVLIQRCIRISVLLAAYL